MLETKELLQRQITELEKEQETTQKKSDELERKILKLRNRFFDEVHKSLLGKYLKFWETFGSTKKYWHYIKPLDAKKGGKLVYEELLETSYGYVRIYRTEELHFFKRNLVETSEEEYNKEKERILKILTEEK